MQHWPQPLRQDRIATHPIKSILTPLRRERPRPRGFALVIVLWSLGLLALLGTELTSTSRAQLRLATAARDHAQTEAAADGAIRQAVFILLGGKQPGSSRQPLRVRIGPAIVDISTEDESTKVNPNAVPAETLRALLVAVGVDQPRAALLAAEMADWRKRSQNSALGGMKLDQYLGHGLPYRSGDRPFTSVDEIALIPDMTPEILARLRPWLSVYQEGDMRDSDDASPIGSAIVNARVATNQTPAPQFVSNNRIMRITARATMLDGARFVRSAVVRIREESDDDGPIFQVLSWE
jgi:general secretion pathway protein K